MSLHKIPLLLRVGTWLVLSAVTAAGWAASERAFRRVEIPSPVVARQEAYHTPDGHRLLLDLYLPPDGAAPALPGPGPGRPAILAIHGGSWTGGSRRLFRPSLANPHPTAVRLAESGVVVVAADYRLARPGAPSWPAARDDLREAVRWIRRHARKLDVDPHRIAAMGQSAGAHLAALLGTFPGPPDDDARVQAVISFYGPSDLGQLPLQRVERLPHEPVHAFLGIEAATRTDTARDASPVHLVRCESAPMLLFHGTLDPWVPIAQSEELAKALEAANVMHQLVRIEGARHGFDAVVAEPSRRDLLPEVFAFLRNVWNAPSR